MTQERKQKVIIAKIGLDDHDVGAQVVAMMLRDAGMEVVYLGLHNKAEEIVNAAVQEDADVIGISSLSGEHLAHTRQLIDALKEKGMTTPVIAGGIIPKVDAAEMLRMGVKRVFMPGTPRETIIDYIKSLASTGRVTA